MEEVRKRIFVGNLPPTANDKSIKQHFKDIGKVLSITVNNKNSKYFAYIDVVTTTDDLTTLFRKYASKTWNGYTLKLEEAKESFLDRLKRERLENAPKADTSSPSIPSNHHVDKSKQKKKKYAESESSEDEVNDGIVKFKGIYHPDNVVSFESDTEENHTSSKKHAKYNNSEHTNNFEPKQTTQNKQVNHNDDINHLESNIKDKTLTNLQRSKEIENSLLSKFETFNSIWKDDDDDGDPIPTKRKSEPKGKDKVEKLSEKKLKTKKNFTKLEKSVLDNEKRKSSVNQHIQKKTEQMSLIKSALANLDSDKKPNKKTVFSDSENDNEEVTANSTLTAVSKSNNLTLFDDNDVPEDFNLVIQDQFEGPKGQKLLELQSRYQNDERFKLDKRFMDVDNDNNSDQVQQESEVINQIGLDEEKKKQLEILGDVLGHPVSAKVDSTKKKSAEMLRFDPTRSDHSQYVVSTNATETKSGDSTKDGKKRKKLSTEKPETTTVVSKEKFFKVADDLKLKSTNQNEGFSLLQLFGRSEELPNKIQHDIPETMSRRDVQGAKENGKSTEIQRTVVSAQGVWKERVFFSDNDSRWDEGFSFINKKDSDESKQAMGSYEERRKHLKEILRIAHKKHLKRKNPFTKKIGGMKKGMKNNFKKKRSS